MCVCACACSRIGGGRVCFVRPCARQQLAFTFSLPLFTLYFFLFRFTPFVAHVNPLFACSDTLQNIFCEGLFILFSAVMSVWTLFDLITMNPNRAPVDEKTGKPATGQDALVKWRRLHPWQYYCGLVVCACSVVIYIAEAIVLYLLYSELYNALQDNKDLEYYPVAGLAGMEGGFGGRQGGEAGGDPAFQSFAPPGRAAAPTHNFFTSGEAPAQRPKPDANLTNEERERRRQERLQRFQQSAPAGSGGMAR